MKAEYFNNSLSYANRLKAAAIVGNTLTQAHKGFLAQHVFADSSKLEEMAAHGTISATEKEYIQARARFVAYAMKNYKGYYTFIFSYMSNRYGENGPQKTWSAYYFAQAVEKLAKHIICAPTAADLDNGLVKRAMHMLFVSACFSRGLEVSRCTAEDVAAIIAEDTDTDTTANA